MSEVDLINAIEGITRRLESISLAIWIYVLFTIFLTVWGVCWIERNKGFFEIKEGSQDDERTSESDHLS